MLVCPYKGMSKLGHLFKMVAAKSLQYKVNIIFSGDSYILLKDISRLYEIF